MNEEDRRARQAAYHAQYRIKNKEHLQARGVEYRRKNRQKIKAKAAKYYLKSRVERARYLLVNGARFRAKKDDREFNLTVEAMIWPTHCPCCKIELRYGGVSVGQASNAASLDRIDNYGGYTLLNTWVLCRRCNTIKNSGTAFEHRRLADAIDTAIRAAT